MAHGGKVSNISLNLESLNILTFQALKATRGLLHSFVLGWFYSASYFLAKIFKTFGSSLAHEQHRTSHRLDLPHDVGDAGFHMTIGTTAFCGAGDVVQSKSIRGLCWSWTAYEVPDGDIKSSIGYTELMLRWETWANTSFSTICDCGNKGRDMDKNGWGKVRWERRESLGLSLEWVPKLVSQLKVMSPQQKQRQWAETLKRIRSGCVKKKKRIPFTCSFLLQNYTQKGDLSLWVCMHAQPCLTLWNHQAPWNFPGKNTRVGCFLLQAIFPIQGLKPCLPYLLHWQAGSLSLNYLGIPEFIKVLSKRAFQIYDGHRLFHTLFW